MLIAYVILWILYITFTTLYISTESKSIIFQQPWPLLAAQPSSKELLPPDICNTDSECPRHHVCLGGSCIRKLLRGTRCNPVTGRWVPLQIQNAMLAVCSCLDNNLFTQKLFGGDCDINVACGVHGTYDALQKKCICEPGYKADGLNSCIRVPVLEEHYKPCDPGEELEISEIRTADTFHINYLSRLKSSKAKCVKRPCSFDAFSGRPLKHAKYEVDWGCVCDPSYGLFGVVLEGVNKHYLNPKGFDACASIFSKDPQKPIDVKLITYFYLGKREPASIILFDGLDDRDLIPLLRGQQGQFMLRQSLWRFDFAQYFFKTHRTFRARTRSADTMVFDFWQPGGYGKHHIRNHVYLNDFTPEYCKELGRIQREVMTTESIIYKLLYSSPICYVEDRDAIADPIFWDRFILNPQQFHVKTYKELDRFNAFVLSYNTDAMRWSLDMGYSFDIKRFLSIDTNAPEYHK